MALSEMSIRHARITGIAHNPFLRMDELSALLAALRGYGGANQTRLGLRLLLLTGVRTGELRLATPDQFDLEQRLWIIPPEVVKQLQMEMRKAGKQASNIPPYIVPLSVQALEIVRHLLDQVLPAQRYLFAHRSDLTKRISENTLNGALRRMGYDLDGAERDRISEGVGGRPAFSC
jgi:integrase